MVVEVPPEVMSCGREKPGPPAGFGDLTWLLVPALVARPLVKRGARRQR